MLMRMSPPGFALDLSTCVEILTPLFPKLFLPLASIANIGTCAVAGRRC